MAAPSHLSTRRVPQTGSITAIELPVRYVGTANCWLLGGDPPTLIDAGPCNDEALSALEHGLRRHGLRVDDIGLVVVTHHHIDHAGLAGIVSRRSGADVAAIGELADYCADFGHRIDRERAFSCDLMLAHGVPADVIPDAAKVWDFIAANGDSSMRKFDWTTATASAPGVEP